MADETIAAEWARWAEATIPADASGRQRRDLRLAYHAGALAALRIAGTSAAGADDQAGAVDRLRDLYREAARGLAGDDVARMRRRKAAGERGR